MAIAAPPGRARWTLSMPISRPPPDAQANQARRPSPAVRSLSRAPGGVDSLDEFVGD